jgi:hypothetical protein
MTDCRPMSKPLVTNWRKIDASNSKTVDPTVYRQLIGSLMYLVNTRPDIGVAVNSESVHGRPSESTLDCYKACAFLLERYSGVRIVV